LSRTDKDPRWELRDWFPGEPFRYAPGPTPWPQAPASELRRSFQRSPRAGTLAKPGVPAQRRT